MKEKKIKKRKFLVPKGKESSIYLTLRFHLALIAAHRYAKASSFITLSISHPNYNFRSFRVRVSSLFLSRLIATLFLSILLRSYGFFSRYQGTDRSQFSSFFPIFVWLFWFFFFIMLFLLRHALVLHVELKLIDIRLWRFLFRIWYWLYCFQLLVEFFIIGLIWLRNYDNRLKILALVFMFW